LLHDAIKDLVRFTRLRRGKSLRSHLRLLFDKSLGWIIVSEPPLFTSQGWVLPIVRAISPGITSSIILGEE